MPSPKTARIIKEPKIKNTKISISDFEIGDCVIDRYTYTVYKVVGYGKKRIYRYYHYNNSGSYSKPCLNCVKLCSASGKATKTHTSLNQKPKYKSSVLPTRAIKLTIENYDSFIEQRILEIRSNMEKIKPFVKLQSRIKRAMPVA